MDLLKLMALGGSAALLFIVIELIRRGRLKERYSLLWLLSGVILLILSSWKDLLDRIAGLIGIYYAPSLLFLFAFCFLLLITLHFSVVVSGLSEKNKELAQELALLRLELKEISQKGKS